VTQPPSRTSADLRHATHVGSSPSWHEQAAYAALELAARARMLETSLRGELGLPERPRGGSTHNTIQAVNALPGLCVGAPQDAVREALDVLNRWIGKARIIVGEVEPLRRLPRDVGGAEPRCPWCDFMTLRQQPYAGLLRCVNPACRDQNGNRVVGRVEFGRLSAQPILVWDSGDVGLSVRGVDA
jgi:hypothetical protein